MISEQALSIILASSVFAFIFTMLIDTNVEAWIHRKDEKEEEEWDPLDW